MRVAAILFFTASLAASGASYSDGEVTVRCRIVDDIHGNPIPRARLTLTGGALPAPLVADSDSQGSCTFPGIPSGSYSLVVEKAGYFPVRSGVPNSAPSLVFAAHAPNDADLGSITLVAMRRILGVVRWQDGEPAATVIAHALRVREGKAPYRAGEVSLTGTNERGEFTLDRLRPGRYVVYAYLPGLAPNNGARPKVALPTFYPGSTTPDIGSAVDLRKVPEISLVLTLQAVTGVSVSGQVVPGDGAPKGSAVHLGLFLPGNPAQAFAGTTAAAGEEFHILDVPPGSYMLFAVASNLSIRAFQPVQVKTEPVKGISVTLTGAVQISGTAVVVQPGNAEPKTLPAADVALRAQSEVLQIYGFTRNVTKPSGEFTLDGAYPGETYMVRIDPPPGTYIQKVVQNTRELSESPFPVVAGGGPVEITLGKDGGTVTGSLNRNNGDQSKAFIVLAPDDRKREDRFRVATTDTGGNFQIVDVPPGDYQAFALDRNEDDAYLADGYLDGLGGAPVRVHVGPSQTQRIQLKVVPVTGTAQ